MNKEKVLQWLGSNVDFYITKAIKQRWYKTKYSYLIEPRPDFGLLFIKSGSVDFFTGKEVLNAHAGNLVFLPQNSRYEAVFTDKTEDYLVCFKADVADDFAFEPIILLDTSPISCAETMHLMSEKNKYETQTKLYNKGLFYLLLDSIFSISDEKYDEHSLIVKRASEMIQKNTCASIKSIAKECAISASALRQMFAEKMGISPIRYRTNIKLRQAMYLIESTDMSLNEIAESLSFFDAAYFCKVFKTHTGMTPKEYAKNKKL